MNKPYVKEYKQEIITKDGIDYVIKSEILNPITKDEPYLHKEASVRGKSKKRYQYFHNQITGKLLFMVRMFGNNRKNTCKRGNQSRLSLK